MLLIGASVSTQTQTWNLGGNTSSKPPIKYCEFHKQNQTQTVLNF